MLLAYFRSGWAFLIPYLAAYLLYAWLKLPVNAPRAGITEPGAWSWVPALLHVYWLLHAIHLVLAGITLVSWWRRPSVLRPLSSVFWPLTPWLCLGLLFYIPGVYLEFPADPIVHFGRIIAWNDVEIVTGHSVWKKSSYFLAYSIVDLSDTRLLTQMLTAYYTGACVLLCWQYYRLGLALGLSRMASFFFCSLQLLLAGNSAFSFHRYYGLSSTIFAQLAVIALLRITLQILQASTKCRTPRDYLGAFISASTLLLLICFNHFQGVLLAAVGCAALLCWRLVSQHRTALAAIFVIIVLASGVVVAIGMTNGMPLAAQGWLANWGAFDLLSMGSAAQHRVLEILGVTGLVSVALGVVMIFRNHPGGWLMTLPWLLLLMPATATPLAVYLNHLGPEYLSAFSRLLLIMPLALPFAWLLDKIIIYASYRSPLPLGIALGTILLVVAMPATPYGHNRAWHALMRPPQNLGLPFIWQAAPDIRSIASAHPGTKLLGGGGASYLLSLTGVPEIQYARRLLLYPQHVAPAEDQEVLRRYFHFYVDSRDILLVVPRPAGFVAPASQSAQVSHHWLAQEAALTTAGGVELVALAAARNFSTLLSTQELTVLTSLPTESKPSSSVFQPR